jgi:hypothetical protein|nr:MAG TPA: hypothetical protein [Caudoviricetes sp.]
MCGGEEMNYREDPFLVFDDEKGWITHTVHPSGFVDNELLTDEPEAVQVITKIWIEWCITPTKTVNKRTSSYALKHCFERMTGIYLTNNQFKQAMAMCGYLPHCDCSELNWTYAISSRSACFKSYHKGKYNPLICEYAYGLKKEKSAEALQSLNGQRKIP